MYQSISKLYWRCICLSLAQGGLVCFFPPLVWESNLMRSGNPAPYQFIWPPFPVVIQPRRFIRPVAIRALPNFANISSITTQIPSHAYRRNKTMSTPCLGFRRVFKHSSERPDRPQSRSETASIISWPIVFPPPISCNLWVRMAPIAGKVDDRQPGTVRYISLRPLTLASNPPREGRHNSRLPERKALQLFSYIVIPVNHHKTFCIKAVAY